MYDYEICASCGEKIKKSVLNESAGKFDRPKQEHRHTHFLGGSSSYCSYMCCMIETCFQIEEKTSGKQTCFRCLYVHHWDNSKGIHYIVNGVCPACNNQGR